jgi:hypothetical protein
MGRLKKLKIVFVAAHYSAGCSLSHEREYVGKNNIRSSCDMKGFEI